MCYKCENIKLGCMVDGKHKEITAPTLEMTTALEIQDVMENTNTSLLRMETALTAYFEAQNKAACILKIFGQQYFRALHNSLPNNWLKRHGLPMRRKNRGRK